MQQQYPFRDIEQQAQQDWSTQNAFVANEMSDKPKYYCLSMFPYPSGKLHMGHVRNYTIGDVLSRYQRMQGYNVMQPMGWDAFGLPAENAAIQNNVPPAKWTRDNIAHMRRQLQSLGFAIDWSREITTCDPGYYKWNQWLFLRMLKKGIAYKKTQVVNWDPVDQTVLANEQVIDGHGWRTGALVEKREIPGYYLNITQYAQELLGDLDKLPGWPERVKTMQANWLGKSVGVRFAFPYELDDKQGKLWVFTTRADTIMGVTFVAVAAEHPLATHAAKNSPQLASFIEKCKHASVMEADLAVIEKAGMNTGLKVTHPLTGEQVPVWVGNYVLMSYGEGAVMAVPAHDERDHAFAQEYGMQIRPVIVPEDWPSEEVKLSESLYHHHDGSGEKTGPVLHAPGLELGLDGQPKRDRTIQWATWQPVHSQLGRCVLSGPLNGLTSTEAVNKVAELLVAKGLGDKQINWRLRDWSVSRQRYWGCPIPIVRCESCGDVPVPDEQLPVVLPEDCVPDGSGNPLNKREDFINCTCPKCGKAARRETDTMDTFVDSSWYYARYTCPDNATAMLDERTNHWMPVDQYIGGIEHAILHLLYSRFWTKAMRDIGLVNYDEPFAHLLTQGMVLNHVFSRRMDKGGIEYFAPEEVELLHDESGKIIGAKCLADGKPVDFQGMGTMSKSKRNGVDPQSLIEQYGADTARFFMMFAAPPEQTLEWSDAGIEGAHRFLRRIWAFALEIKNKHILLKSNFLNGGEPIDSAQADARRHVHLVLKQANHDMHRQQFNTVASAAMKLLNILEKTPKAARAGQRASPSAQLWLGIAREGFSILLRVLSPIAPHISQALWKELSFGDDILSAPWPEPSEAAMVQDEIGLVIQVNGKLRGNMAVAGTLDKESLEKLALQQPCVQKYLEGTASVRKIIVVPGKLINVVVG